MSAIVVVYVYAFSFVQMLVIVVVVSLLSIKVHFSDKKFRKLVKESEFERGRV